MKNHFNKNLIMCGEEEQFQANNTSRICKKLVNNGKLGGATHSSCNINLQLTKKFPVIFQNLRGYDSHLISVSLTNLM